MAAQLIAPLAMAIALFAASSVGASGTGKQAWTDARTSKGLHRVGQSAIVVYHPAPGSVPPGSIITQVYADRDYAGQDDVQTSLCWNGIDRCIDITRRSVNSKAFNGLNAGSPMYLVHTLRARRGNPTPLYIKGNVSVWFRPGEARSVR